MKFLVALALIACVSADVSHLDNTAAIVQSNSDISPDGSFKFGYETSNGIVAQAEGVVKDGEYPSLVVRGGYKYDSPDGTPIQLTYTADEEGFKPDGAHLPVPPEVPEPIRRALAYIASHPPAKEV